MISIVPGYISRSVAGSYDNEGIAIFCMLLTYYLWIKSVKTGGLWWSTLCAIAYFYMVCIYCFSKYNLVFFRWNKQCFFLGFFMGWLCVFNKPHSFACACLNGYRTIFTSHIYSLFNSKFRGFFIYYISFI